MNRAELRLDGPVAPAWIEVIPRGPAVVGRDGRAFTLDAPQAVVDAFTRRGTPIVVDFDHATERPELAANAGAAGWIEELAVRDGAIVARVDWTPRGRRAVEGREYRFVSPVFFHTRDAVQRIVSLTSVGLVHSPNLHLAALNAAASPSAQAKASNMIINNTNIRSLQIGFKQTFEGAFSGVEPLYEKIATIVPSSTAEETYAWLGNMPTMREWIGERVLSNISDYQYAIKNRSWEMTIEVPRERIEDDQFGIYTPMFSEMGRAAAVHPDRLTFELLKAGFSTLCYDGQFFFDTDHAVKHPQTGDEMSFSNMQAGAGPAWYLMDLRRSIKPLIFQERKKAELVSQDDPERSGEVFMRNVFRYGAYARYNVGFGFWQMAFGSKAPLTSANLRAARLAMRKLRRDNGEPLGVNPTHLVVGPSLSDTAREILHTEHGAGGATNIDFKLFELLESEWLD